MSSPARSTVSVTSAGVGVAISGADDLANSVDALYRKDEAMAGRSIPSPLASPSCLPFSPSFATQISSLAWVA